MGGAGVFVKGDQGLHRLSTGRAALIVLLTAALAVSACSTFGKKKKPTLAYEERPVDLLYNAGADRLDRHQWTEAVEYFREVERQHPYSEWARRSILMTAYAHYQANDYAEAIADADQFIALYPGNPSTPYAYYLKATCYFEQIVDVGRDQAATSEAGEMLREVSKRYPYTEYAADARLKLDMVQDQLAGKEMNIGRFYLRTDNPMGAINRFKTVVNKYQTTSHTPEALYRLVEANLTVGLIQEAKENGAVLGYNYPGDPWYQAAYQLLTSKGYRPSVAPNPEGRRGPHIPNPFGHHDKAALPPPTEEAAPPAPTSISTASAPAPVTDADASQTAAAPSASPAQQPAAKKPAGFLHGFLGL
jgi:outer membrane protein assembly factor BamD